MVGLCEMSDFRHAVVEVSLFWVAAWFVADVSEQGIGSNMFPRNVSNKPATPRDSLE